jgi:hypothetical protein
MAGTGSSARSGVSKAGVNGTSLASPSGEVCMATASPVFSTSATSALPPRALPRKPRRGFSRLARFLIFFPSTTMTGNPASDRGVRPEVSPGNTSIRQRVASAKNVSESSHRATKRLLLR